VFSFFIGGIILLQIHQYDSKRFYEFWAEILVLARNTKEDKKYLNYFFHLFVLKFLLL